MNNMSSFARAMCAASAFASMAACASPDSQPELRSRSVQLAEHQTVTLAPAISLTYESVADSRCPKSVQCVVAGKVSHRFTLTSKGGNESFSLGTDNPQFDSANLQGVTFALANDPAPASPGVKEPVVVDVVVK
ncbi:MAG: hypothetical protein JWP34_2091 [Massilia sp.]|jgi:hypothetical protein|nr:hypothetical protein [Massilia sp.]MDB5907977.1 hypothetical protein [Massilia sp.]